MAATDNFYAGLSGGAQAVTGVLDKFIDYKFKRKSNEDDLLAQEASKIRLMGEQTNEDIRKAQEIGTAVYNPTTGQTELVKSSKFTQLKTPSSSKDIGGLSYGQQQAVFKLSDDYEKASKDSPVIVQAYNRIRAVAKNPSPAGDLSLIYSYVKMQDPTSVVRESEFANAAATGSFGEKIKAQVNRILNGEQLSDAIRDDFVKSSYRLYNASMSQQKMINDQFSSRANRFGIDPSFVVRDMSSFPEVEGDELSSFPAITPTQRIEKTKIQPKKLTIPTGLENSNVGKSGLSPEQRRARIAELRSKQGR